MGIRVVRFEAEHLPAMVAFSERYWIRPRTPSYYRWRYLDSLQFMPIFVALDEAGACAGTVSAIRKTYRVREQDVSVLEVFDWHCLPELKGTGVGIRIMRAMMRLGEPLLSIGGTRDAVSTIAAMRWTRIGSARMYHLPLSGHTAAEAIERRIGFHPGFLRAPLGIATYAWYGPTIRLRPAGGRAIPVAAPGEEVAALYHTDSIYGFAQIPDPTIFRWVAASYPGNGHFIPVVFVVNDRLCGWALTRIRAAAHGFEADILDLFAPSPTVDLYTWMVSECAVIAAQFSPIAIRARATCPLYQAALQANRFREDTADIAVHFWPTPGLENVTDIHVTLNHSDEPLRPYPLAATGLAYLVA
jgi:hypothetical protein